MGQAKLLKTTLILPRVETHEAVSKLAELEWFHTLQNPSEHSSSYFDDLLLNAQKLFQEIDEVIRSLGISLETGVMATLFKGAPQEKTDYKIDDIQNFIVELENKSKTLLEEPVSLLKTQQQIEKDLEEYRNALDAIGGASKLKMDLSGLRNLKTFFAEIFIINSKDLHEIQNSLGDLIVHPVKLNDEKSSITVIGSQEDSEKIMKVLRSFNVHPIQIPSDLPQNPSSAYDICQKTTKELEKKYAEITKKIEKLKVTILPKLLSLYESSKTAKDILEITRKPAGTKNFAVIQGYIPVSMENKFKTLTDRYISVTEPVKLDRDSPDQLPTLLVNNRYAKTFEVITETQGLPNHGEVDPTPIIAFVWPVFYGIMFADLGHGLLLFGLGMFLRYRGIGNLKTWGTLLAASGAAASIAGLGTGEMFGFHIDEIAILAPLFEPLGPLVGALNVSELTFDQVIKILKVSVAIGIVHILMALFLRLRNDILEKNKLIIFTHDIPTIIQFLAVVALILAAIGSGYDIIGMFGVTGVIHNEPVPWLTFLFGDWVTVDLVAKATPPIIIATAGIMIWGGKKEQDLAAKHGHDEGGGLMGIVIEVILVRIIEVLSNVISYTRLGIMLLVHAALLVTVNQSYESGGGLAVLIGGNIGIMLIEGLIVYIQTIRLHLYEWFPKWYRGEGVGFKKLIPDMLYSNLLWSGKRTK
ncbi:MAG: V-type ATPase 116kDa subunit family protein [Nitrososphaeraceae archaeon]|jgi:V/A-type H+-transporting ATPase subunit I|nr:V-type ATPase 116kDa subunit family protein [Nitrososphaeraceae archaeon]